VASIHKRLYRNLRGKKSSCEARYRGQAFNFPSKGMLVGWDMNNLTLHWFRVIGYVDLGIEFEAG
jgi:hypothetical protein